MEGLFVTMLFGLLAGFSYVKVSSVSLWISSHCCCGSLSNVLCSFSFTHRWAQSGAEASVSVLVLFSVRCWTVDSAQQWQVGGVTVPSVRPRSPSVMQVTSALISLISLMSLFLGGPTNEYDLNTQEPDGFALQDQKTQISWQLLT